VVVEATEPEALAAVGKGAKAVVMLRGLMKC
jgi:hypothetical protein